MTKVNIAAMVDADLERELGLSLLPVILQPTLGINVGITGVSTLFWDESEENMKS